MGASLLHDPHFRSQVFSWLLEHLRLFIFKVHGLIDQSTNCWVIIEGRQELLGWLSVMVFISEMWEITLLVVTDLRELVWYSIRTIYPVSQGLRNQQKRHTLSLLKLPVCTGNDLRDWSSADDLSRIKKLAHSYQQVLQQVHLVVSLTVPVKWAHHQ